MLSLLLFDSARIFSTSPLYFSRYTLHVSSDSSLHAFLIHRIFFYFAVHFAFVAFFLHTSRTFFSLCSLDSFGFFFMRKSCSHVLSSKILHNSNRFSIFAPRLLEQRFSPHHPYIFLTLFSTFLR